MAAIWSTGELWLRVPETIRIDLIGVLPAGVTAKDLSLWVLRQLGSDAGIYTALEFGGPGLASLSLESRMVIPNMMAEAGAKNVYLEPDDAVFDWLAQRLAARSPRVDNHDPFNSASAGFNRLPPASDGGFNRRAADHAPSGFNRLAITTHSPPARSTPTLTRPTRRVTPWILAALEPLVARPHNPANVVPLSQVSGVHVDQAFLGTCTNGRLEDLAAAAAVFREADGSVRRVAPGTRLLVIPASSQVLQDAMAAGYIQTFLAVGAMIGTPGCGPCMGNHMGVPAPSEVTISSANRNFNGRMGTPGSQVYLASPAVVAASAVLGRIGGPGEVLGGNSKLEAGNSKLEAGSWSAREAGVEAGNMKLATGQVANSARPASRAHPPVSSFQLPVTSNQLPVSGRAWVYGDNVNTDVIFPGKYTYTISDPAEMARHALEDLDPSFAGGVGQGDIIVAGRNWGCGSSREQAATCLRAAGVQTIIAASFARIFFRNAVNNGLLPIACPDAAAVIQPGEVVTVDVGRCLVRCATGEYSFPPLSDSLQRIVEAGGLVPMLKQAIMAAADSVGEAVQ